MSPLPFCCRGLSRSTMGITRARRSHSIACTGASPTIAVSGICSPMHCPAAAVNANWCIASLRPRRMARGRPTCACWWAGHTRRLASGNVPRNSSIWRHLVRPSLLFCPASRRAHRLPSPLTWAGWRYAITFAMRLPAKTPWPPSAGPAVSRSAFPARAMHRPFSAMPNLLAATKLPRVRPMHDRRWCGGHGR